MADRLGPNRIGVAALVTRLSGLAMTFSGMAAEGFLVVCTGSAISSALLPGIAAHRSGRDRLSAISSLVTWRDLGAALGALVTGFLIPVVDLSALYLGVMLLLAVTTCWLVSQSFRQRVPGSQRDL